MTEEKHVYQTDFMALPAFRVLVSEVISNSERKLRTDRLSLQQKRELEVPVKRLIAHLQNEMKE